MPALGNKYVDIQTRTEVEETVPKTLGKKLLLQIAMLWPVGFGITNQISFSTNHL